MSNEFRDSWRTFAALAAMVLISAATMVVARFATPKELEVALYAAATTLLFGGILGSVLKALFDDLIAARARRADAATFVSNVLADLKAVYDRVGRARILIPAHRSVRTYGIELRDLINARVQLKNVIRALLGRAEGVSQRSREAVIESVGKMRKYLDELTTEFRDNYKRLSVGQRFYEDRASSLTAEHAARREDEAPATIDDTPWKALLRLPVLADFVGAGARYEAEFERELDRASRVLRAEHAAILGHSIVKSKASS